MSTSVITAKNIVKTVSTNSEQLTILEKVNLEIKSGESVAIVGTSGAGKSTLMTLLAGLDTPSEGQISLLEYPISELDDEQRAKIRGESVGFVFQSFLLIPSLTALENVTLPCLLAGQEEDTERALQLLKSVGLDHRVDHLPSQLSGGEQQRVALARAFMLQPKVLFADEPTGNLDQHTAETVVNLLFELNRKHGTTLVMVTHDTTLANQCDTVYRMQAGHLYTSEQEVA
ncbi:ABC transporter ATP-binding protein [Vibrio ulleungensis]|jgi:putative ABC transport system ATP-binding protein|uniref:ABC transporter ATP-binding protein n=1 Tax=Vibrio ulleungensis TaxID=2807619 RepID=A0ABS2HIL0_9VIBR|nr:ABC transporter ATP-binding protein [Vibrio ulleungensis]MBM7035682.1 ABC transporter ATP-binding protein [Vibrio ulleungensis]